MNMKKALALTAAITLTAQLTAFSGRINAESVKADIDPALYESLMKFEQWDADKDGILSEEEFSEIEHMSVNLFEVTDISCLKKASSLRHLSLYGGEITDFSVLAEVPSLRTLTFSGVPVSDISFAEKLGLTYMSLTETNVSSEDKIRYAKAPDIEIPAGFYDNFSLKPAGLLECNFVIEDDSIAGFDQEASKETEERYYNHILGKKPGETTYSVVMDGETVMTGKIKITSPEITDPPLDSESPKVVKAERIPDRNEYYSNDLDILLSDGNVYRYSKGKYTHTETGAADIGIIPLYGSDTDRSCDRLVLYRNGYLTFNGNIVHDISGEAAHFTSIYSCYALQENGRLIRIYPADSLNSMTVLGIGYDFDYIIDTGAAVKKDGTFVKLGSKADQIKEVQKFDIKSVAHLYDYYVLENNGDLWCVSYEKGKATLISSNVTEAGFPEANGVLGSDFVYITEDGKAWNYKFKKEVTVPEEHIMHDTYDYDFNDYNEIFRESTHYGFAPGTSIAGIEYENDDRIYAQSVRYPDNTEYFSCFSKHSAITNVDRVLDSYSNGTDSVIHFIRTDGQLWEYAPETNEFRKISFIPDENITPAEPEPPEEIKPYTAEDLVKAVKYMLGQDGGEAYDLNRDNKTNIADINFLKLLITAE